MRAAAKRRVRQMRVGAARPSLPVRSVKELIDRAGGQVQYIVESLPPAVAGKLQREIVRVMNQPDVKDLLLTQGAEAWTIGPQEFLELQRSETELYARIIREAGIKVE